jgi:predicted phage tail component-like protein
MQKLVFTNGGGQTIDLTSGNFGITNWEGLSGVGLNIQTQQVPFQDGGVFLDALMEQREISVTVAIQDNNDLSLRYELKRQLISALNPKLGEGVLVYTNDYLSRQIKAVPQLPIFENKNSNDAGTLKANVTFSCPSPYWEDLEDTVVEIDGLKATINNDGDVPVGVKINATSSGGVISIINMADNKNITLLNTEASHCEINTNMGQKSIGIANPIYQALMSYVIGAFELNGVLFESSRAGVSYIDNNLNEISVNIQCAGGNELRTPVKKDNYVYAYIDYIGIVRTSDGEKYETVYSNTVLYYLTLSKTSNGRIVLCNGGAVYSDDGENWIAFQGVINDSAIKGIEYATSKQKYYAFTTEGIYSSSDMQQWTSEKTLQDVTSIFYDEAQGKFIIGAGLNVYTTTDFSTLTTIHTATSSLSEIYNFGNTYFFQSGTKLMRTSNLSDVEEVSNIVINERLMKSLIVGETYNLILSNGTILRSFDLYTWYVYYQSPSGAFGSTIYEAIKTQDNYIMGYARSGGNYYIYAITPDLEAIKSETGFNQYYDIKYFRYNNKYYVLHNGKIYESTDGITYTQISTTTLLPITIKATEDKVYFYIVENNIGSVYTSSDCINWTKEIDGLNYSVRSIPVKYKNFYYASIYQSSNGKTYIAKSEDLLNFTALQEVVQDEIVREFDTDGNILYCLSSSNFVDGNSTVYKIVNDDITEIQLQEICASIAVRNKEVFLTTTFNGQDCLGRLSGRSVIAYNNLRTGLSNVFNLDGNICVLGTGFGGVLKNYSYDNIIDKLTPNSNMNFYLLVGKNTISKNYEGSCEITFRQKYIGV